MEIDLHLLEFISKKDPNLSSYSIDEAKAVCVFKREASALASKLNVDCVTFNFWGELICTTMRGTSNIKDINFISYTPEIQMINVTLGGIRKLISIRSFRENDYL